MPSTQARSWNSSVDLLFDFISWIQFYQLRFNQSFPLPATEGVMERDRYMSPMEAQDFGLIDRVLVHPPQAGQDEPELIQKEPAATAAAAAAAGSSSAPDSPGPDQTPPGTNPPSSYKPEP